MKTKQPLNKQPIKMPMMKPSDKMHKSNNKPSQEMTWNYSKGCFEGRKVEDNN